jgi:Cu/Ag efflux protein CusF
LISSHDSLKRVIDMNHCCSYIASLLMLALAGCDEPSPPNQESVQSVPTPGAGTAAEHTGFGTVNSIDRAAGTVNISHAAVASADWPAMTMDFRLANPDMAEKLDPGERIEFRFTTEEGGTITAAEPLP